MPSYNCNKDDLPPIVSGGDTGSFAQYTLDNRFPHIIDEIIHYNELSDSTVNDLIALKKEVKVGEISALTAGAVEDSELWAECLSPYLGESWYKVPFLFAEMYFYRRIFEATNASWKASDKPLDPFKAKKESSLLNAGDVMQKHARLLHDASESMACDVESLERFIAETIWSNRNDLSQIPGDVVLPGSDDAKNSSEFLLANELSSALELITDNGKLGRIDVLLDNCGHELLADLALVCYMLDADCVSKIYLHCKKFPIFVSDATIDDVEYAIGYLAGNTHADTARWGGRLESLVAEGRLLLCDSPFWSLPTHFRDMPEVISSMFQSSDLVVLKGDANYRRLVDDRYWKHDEPLQSVIKYFPTSCLILRVLKSEVLVGLDLAGRSRDALSENWLTEGKYGVIQFYKPNGYL